jgi:hypothetical protein
LNCARYRQLLSRYVDDEVTPRQRQELLTHVQSCHDCAAWLARIRQTNVLLKGVPETRPSDRVRAAVLGSVHQPGTSTYVPHVSGLQLNAVGLLLRFDPSPQRIVLVLAASLVAMIGLAYWLNLMPPWWGYTKLGFEFPRDNNPTTVDTRPLPAVSQGYNGVGGPMAVPNLARLLPAGGSQDVALDQALRVRFDLPMDRASVEDALSIDPPTAGTFGWDADNEVRFSPTAPGLLRGITYTISLTNTARSLAGTPLDKPISWSFHTKEPYSVTSIVAAGATIALTAAFTLAFQVPMDQADTAGKVVLHAGGAGEQLPPSLNWSPDGQRLTISPVSPLPLGPVTLHVDSTARTQAGDILGKPAEFSYQVALPAPRLRILDGRLLVTSPSGPAQLHYEAVAGAKGTALQDVAFDIYRMPAERLSALGAQAHPWPLTLPEGFAASLERVGALQSTPGNGASSELPLVVPHLQPGIYLLTASTSSEAGILSDWQLLVVADGALTLTNEGGPIWATTAEGRAWPGGEISLYSSDGMLMEKGLTNEAGLWLPSNKGSGATLAIAQDVQGHVAALALASGRRWGDTPSGALSVSLQTDLTSYLPGQALNFRALLRSTHDQAPPTPIAEQNVSVLLINPGGSVISSLTLKPDSVGGINGLFQLSPDLKPGAYFLRVRAASAQRDFPIQVVAPTSDTLSVYIAPSVAQPSATAITHTISVLGPSGQLESGAILTATLRIEGDNWVSTPVTATTNDDDRATIVYPLPSWLAGYSNLGVYLNVDASSGMLHGTATSYLDLTSARAAHSGIRQMVSPVLDVAAIARPLSDGTTRLRLVELGISAPVGDLLVIAQAPTGERSAWSLDLAKSRDVTLEISQRFAGGSLHFFRVGQPGSRELALVPAKNSGLSLSVVAPQSVSPGSSLPVQLDLTDSEGHGLNGTASLWLRRVSGEQSLAGQAWEPSVSLSASGAVTSTVTAPDTPGLWFVMVEAALEDGSYTDAWAVIDVVLGPQVQLPPAQDLQSGQAQPVGVVVYNPGAQALVANLSADADSGLQMLGSAVQSVNVEADGWQWVEWQAKAQEPGLHNLSFSFLPSSGVAGKWTLDLRAEGSPQTKTNYASGVSVGERTVAVQVPSGLSNGAVQLEIRASTSLLSALADIAGGLKLESAQPGETVTMSAARLSAAPSVASVYRRTGASVPDQLLEVSLGRSLALQQLYSSQHVDGGWGTDADTSKPSDISTTASVVLAMRRQSLAWTDAGGEPQPAVDTSVVNRGLAYLASQATRPLGEHPTTTALDEHARAFYALSMYGSLQPEVARPLIAYTGSAAGSVGLSRAGQGWLALALWQTGNTEDALAIIDHVLATQTEPDAAASAPLLEALIAASNTARQESKGGQDPAVYQNAARSYARALMESRQGLGWPGKSATADALWALSRYAAGEEEKAQPVSPLLTLNDHPVQASGASGDSGSVSVLLSGGALHAGDNWLTIKAPLSGESLYYSLTLRANR